MRPVILSDMCGNLIGVDVTQTNTAIEAAFRESYSLVVASLSRQVRDIDLAEEAIQDAFAEAMRSWPETGPPANPGGWIATVARRRAIDRIRREKTYTAKKELLASLEKVEAERPAVPMLGRNRCRRPAPDDLRLLSPRPRS